MDNFLKNITYLLQSKKMTWYQFSKQTGIPESSLWDYRHHRKRDLTLTVAMKMAKVLDQTIDDLLNEDLTK